MFGGSIRIPLPTTVTLHRAGEPTQDDYGNDVATLTSVPVPGCVVWPSDANSGGSNEQNQARDTVITGLTVLAPAGTVVAATDQMSVPGYGEPFDVVGLPASWGPSPLTGTHAGVQVSLRRVTG